GGCMPLDAKAGGPGETPAPVSGAPATTKSRSPNCAARSPRAPSASCCAGIRSVLSRFGGACHGGNGGQSIGLKQIHLRLYRRNNNLLTSFSFSWLRFFHGAVRLFQMREDVLGAVENFLRNTGEPGHMDAVTFVGASRDDLAKENNLLIPLAHGDVEVRDAFPFRSQLCQLMVMGCEKSARFDFVVEKLGHAPGDREAVEG